jgi:MFS superfamily sulfate permease-like transporter
LRIEAIHNAKQGIIRQLSLGPEAALCLLIGQMIQEVVYSDPHSIPKHPELEAAALSLITTFQVSFFSGSKAIFVLM